MRNCSVVCLESRGMCWLAAWWGLTGGRTTEEERLSASLILSDGGLLIAGDAEFLIEQIKTFDFPQCTVGPLI